MSPEHPSSISRHHQTHADAVRALSWIFSMNFLLTDGGSPRIIKKTEVELAIKPLQPTSIGNTVVIQPFLIYCSRRSSYFSHLRWCARSKFSSKGTVNSATNTFFFFFALTDQMTISGRFAVNAISIGNMKVFFNRLRRASPCSPQAMMFYIYFYEHFSKYFLL